MLHSALKKYEAETPAKTPEGRLPYPDWLPRTADSPDYDPIEDFIGMIDADVTDMSTTVRETMDEYYQKKYGSST